MIKKNRIISIVIALLCIPHDSCSWIYLWEMRDGPRASCCLHYCGIEICNPYKPCTKFSGVDLVGIFDYVSRLAMTEHAKIGPHPKILAQVKEYIASIVRNPHKTILYRVPQYTSIKFYHDIVEADYLRMKDQKGGQAKQKSVKDEFVSTYLAKLGLMEKRR